MMAAYESITNDELNYSLKAKLRRTPEQRYQDKKASWEFHDSNMGNDNSFTGCNNLQCVPDCRYFPEYGGIEDSEMELLKQHILQGKIKRSKSGSVRKSYARKMNWNGVGLIMAHQ